MRRALNKTIHHCKECGTVVSATQSIKEKLCGTCWRKGKENCDPEKSMPCNHCTMCGECLQSVMFPMCGKCYEKYYQAKVKEHE